MRYPLQGDFRLPLLAKGDADFDSRGLIKSDEIRLPLAAISKGLPRTSDQLIDREIHDPEHTIR